MEDKEKLARALQELKQSRQRREFAERTAHLGYWELDLETKRFYWSKEMYRIFGYAKVIKNHKRNLIREGIFAEDFTFYKQQIKKLFSGARLVDGKIRLRRPSGEVAYCRFRAGFVVRGDKRKIASTFQDITQEIKTKEELRAAKKKAEEANKAKSYFLAQASHDLRQPMQALQLFVESLSEEKLKTSQQKLVQKISASAAGLKSLLDNLLDISKLDSGGIRVEVQRFNIGTIFCRLCLEYHQTAASQGLDVICRIGHFGVETDSFLLERIIRNLFSNALKYAKHKILISCRKDGDEACIRIIDDGCGIKEQEQRLIFEEFYQSREVKDNRSNGAGLGLSIVKRLAVLLEAKIHIRSRHGHYSAFEVLVPLHPLQN